MADYVNHSDSESGGIAMAQPKWKLVANLGDASPLEYGGYFVYVDETGVYAPEATYLYVSDSGEEPYAEVHRFVLEPCTYVNGVLSDNPFHPDHAAWFATPEAKRAERPQDSTYLSNIASTGDIDVDELIRLFTSADAAERAHAWRYVGEYHGFHELDQYPLTFKNQFRFMRYVRKYHAEWEDI